MHRGHCNGRGALAVAASLHYRFDFEHSIRSMKLAILDVFLLGRLRRNDIGLFKRNRHGLSDLLFCGLREQHP